MLNDGDIDTSSGLLPRGWVIVELDEICTVDWGNTSLTKSIYSLDGFPAFSAAGQDGFTDFYEHEGDAIILSAIGARCGKCFWASGKWTAIKNTIVIKSRKGSKVDLSYLFYLVNDERFWPRSGTSQPFIGIGHAKKQQIPLPPFPEQRAIAHVLTTVRQSIEASERVIVASHELKRSLVKYLFTYGPVPINQVEAVILEETNIGAVPREWEIYTFDKVITIESGQVDPQKLPYREMFHIGPENIEEATGRLLPLKTASELKLMSGKYLFTPDDVVYSKIRPYLRKAALPGFTGICSADMYPVRPKHDDLSITYLFQYLLSELFSLQAISYQSRTGIPKINRVQLNSIYIPLPSRKIQEEIASHLSTIDDKIRNELMRKSILESIFSSLLHYLMTGKVRVTNN